MFLVLLPIIWVVASAFCAGTPLQSCTLRIGETTLTAKDEGQQDPSGLVGSMDQMIRRTSRRAGISMVPDGSAVPFGMAQERFKEIQSASPFSAGSQSPLYLVHCWHFLQRAALAPRAPSLDS